MAGSIVGAVAAPLIGGAVSSMFGGGARQQQAGAVGASDPFAGQRGQYQQQLQQLMSDPNSFQMSSAAKFAEQEGMNALSAQMASRGLQNSGAESAALTKYATGYAGQQYQQQLQNLMQLSGANTGSPAAAGQLMSQQAGSDLNALNTFGSSIGTAVTGTDAFKGLFSPGSTDMAGFQMPSSPIGYTPDTGPGNPIPNGTLGTGTMDFSSLSDLMYF